MSCREDSIRLRRKHQVSQCASQADAVEVGAEVPRWSDSGRLWIVVRAGNGGEDGAGVGATAAVRERQKLIFELAFDSSAVWTNRGA